MNGINTAARIISKILEVFHWVGAALMAAAAVCAVAAPDKLSYFVSFDAKECCGAELSLYGFDVQAPLVNGQVDMATFLLFGIGAAAILALMAMVFHNLHQILKRSETASPFQKENIRQLRQIGIFSIAVPVVGFVMSALVGLIVGPDAAEISVSQSGIFMGLVILCLTQYFIHGAQLENDVDGLL